MKLIRDNNKARKWERERESRSSGAQLKKGNWTWFLFQHAYLWPFFSLSLSLSLPACASPLFLAAAAVAADTEASTSAVHPCCLHQWNKSARVPQMLEFSLRVVVVVVLCTEKRRGKEREREYTSGMLARVDSTFLSAVCKYPSAFEFS